MENQNNKREQELKMISNNISYYRRLKNLTQEELAEKSGISRTHLSTIESKKLPMKMSLDCLMNIADALGVPASFLLEFEDIKYTK